MCAWVDSKWQNNRNFQRSSPRTFLPLTHSRTLDSPNLSTSLNPSHSHTTQSTSSSLKQLSSSQATQASQVMSKPTYAKKASTRVTPVEIPTDENAYESFPTLSFDKLPERNPVLVRQNAVYTPQVKSQARPVVVSGYFKSVSDYGDYRLEIHPDVYQGLLKMSSDLNLTEGFKSPLNLWKDLHTINVKVKLEMRQAYDYDNLVSSNIRVTGECSTYDFKNPKGEHIFGWSFRAIKIEPVSA